MTRKPVQATIDGRWQEVAAIEDAFARGEISEGEWHARMAALVVPAYLAADNPRGQSGYSGTEDDWRQARGLVADAIERSGTFLDVGCASGHLMETVVAWCGERGLSIEPYGLDISPELAALARRRLPRWADRIFEGNAATWIPGVRFDVVRTGLEYVPRSTRSQLVAHLLANVVAPDGGLLIGPYNEERDETRAEPSLEDDVRSWGYGVSARLERPHARDDRVVRRLLSIDGGAAYVVRLAEHGDVASLPEVERRAVRLFETHMEESGLTPSVLYDVSEVDELEDARRRGHLWVAISPAGQTAGFAQVVILDNLAHLDEIDVLPEHGRKGVGTRLVDAVRRWAAEAGYPKITLSTFRDVPWNRPLYERLGFHVVDSRHLGREHRDLVAREAARGLRTDLRVIMECPLANTRPIV